MLRRLLLVPLAVLVTGAGVASALERTQVRTTSLPDELWTVSTTCAVTYFNVCAGYIWLWSGFGDDAELGMQFDVCCPGSSAIETLRTIHWNGAPGGYGFSGTVNIYDDANGNSCPDDGLIYTARFLPVETGAGAEVVEHLVGGLSVGQSIVGTITLAHGSISPVNIPSDQGGQPCVPPRSTHSYSWGIPESPACPGFPLIEGAETCEFLWQVGLTCAVAVEGRSWGAIKGLYE